MKRADNRVHRKSGFGRIDFAAINAAAPAVLPSLLARWLPAGRRVGHEWVVGSLRGEPGNSLKVNLRTGIWRDCAADIGGSDPVSLAAALAGLGQADAAQHLAVRIPTPHVPVSLPEGRAP